MFVNNTFMKKYSLFLLLLLISGNCIAIDIYEELANAIRSGDSRQVASYFSNTIDLTILNQEDVYSRAQAELILKDFFSRNSPKSFSLIHKGSSREGTLYAIGTLITLSGKTFRTSFYLKSVNGKYEVQELRFESK